MKNLLVAAIFLTVPFAAFAGDASLENEDNTAHDLKIKCSAGTSSRSIQTTTTIKVADGCTVEVKGGNSETVSSGQTCTIKNGKIACK